MSAVKKTTSGFYVQVTLVGACFHSKSCRNKGSKRQLWCLEDRDFCSADSIAVASVCSSQAILKSLKGLKLLYGSLEWVENYTKIVRMTLH